MRKPVFAHLTAISWAALIALLTLTPGGALSSIGGWVPGWLDPWFDTIAHGVAILVLVLLASRSLRLVGRVRRPTLTAFVAGLGYALLLEVAQRWVPGRSCQWVDLLASAAGASLALLTSRAGEVVRGS